MTTRLRELAKSWKGGTASHDYEMGRQECADELLSVLDAEGDGEAVAEVGRDWTLHWIGHGPIAPIINKHNIRIGDKLYPHPARSGGVSDADVCAAVDAYNEEMGGIDCDLPKDIRDADHECMRAALEHYERTRK